MGVSVNIGMSGDDRAIARRFLTLARRMEDPLFTWGWGGSKASCPDEAGLLELLGSRRRLRASGHVHLRDGGFNPHILMILRGRDCEEGVAWRRDGPLTVGLSLGQLHRGDGMPSRVAEEVFAGVCDPALDPVAPIDHAAMYWECGWPSPTCCPMVFHRRPAEFALDVSRAGRSWREPVWYVDLLTPDPWNAVATHDPVISENREAFLEQLIASRRASNVMRNAHRTSWRPPANLDDDEARTLLHMIGDEPENDVTVMDVGEGVAIATRRFSDTSFDRKYRLGSLGAAYEALVDALS